MATSSPDTRLIRACRFLILFAFLLSLAVSARAQDTVTGAFQGTVTDSATGLPIRGATVDIINEETGQKITLQSDSRGLFYQGLLRPGVYRIRVVMAGYQPHEHLQVLKITYTGEVVPVPVSLDPAPAATGAATPAPTPVATADDTDIRSSITRIDARRTGSFTEAEVSTLPLGGTTITRSFDELALLLPGVAPPPGRSARSRGLESAPESVPPVSSPSMACVHAAITSRWMVPTTTMKTSGCAGKDSLRWCRSQSNQFRNT